jgi:hypothetical protein
MTVFQSLTARDFLGQGVGANLSKFDNFGGSAVNEF